MDRGQWTHCSAEVPISSNVIHLIFTKMNSELYVVERSIEGS